MTIESPGPLGFILPSERTQEQADAHERAMAGIKRMSLPYSEPPVGTKVMLTDFWKRPEVVADIGREFTGFGQLTGSCVGVSEGNAIATVGFVQRMLADNPTKAFVPWWPFSYGRCRFNEGDRGQGEGAVDSVMGETLVKEGFIDANEPGLPAFAQMGADGFWLASQRVELQWSDGGSSLVKGYMAAAAKRAGMTKFVINDVVGIRAAILNGYAVLDGCSNYIGSGRTKGDGENAYVVGHYDGRGGHSTCFLGVWWHPVDGWLYLYSNQWPTSTYPRDPAGAGRCCVWTPESEVAKLFRTGGDKGETMLLSHLPYTPVQQDKIVSFFV